LLFEVAKVLRDVGCKHKPTGDAEAATLDEVLLNVDHEKRVSHAFIG
jgi:hypothetical protein